MKRFSTQRMLMASIAIVAFTIIVVLFVSIRQSQRVKDTTGLVDHTEQVLKHIQKVFTASLENEAAARGFVITADDSFLEPLRSSEKDFKSEEYILRRLTGDNRLQQQWLDSLRIYIDKRIAFSDSMVISRKQSGLSASIAMVQGGAGKRYTNQIRRIGNIMEGIENKLLAEREKKNEATIANLNIILYSVLAAIFLLSIFLIQRINTDVARQKASEKKFSSLLDAAPDATIIVNESGIIQMINLQTENMFGYSRQEMIGRPVEILIPQDLKVKHVQHRDGFVRSPHARTMGAGIELNAVKKDGSMFPVEISLSPIKTNEGMLVSASVRDITLRKNLENELKKTNSELEAFTYSVSHDLRAPLRGIIGFTAILEEEYTDKLDDEARRITGVIKNNTIKMGHLIDDLLAFSRMGRQELIKSPVNMTDVVKEIVEEIKLAGKTQKIQWYIESLPEVRADINTIRQVWINIISNAVKYSGHKEEPQITIGTFVQHGQQVFFVKDNGVGFDNKYKDKLFRVFQRLHSVEEFEGTGVGLALVEKIISRHGGQVWAEGEMGRGASFYFSLPVA